MLEVTTSPCVVRFAGTSGCLVPSTGPADSMQGQCLVAGFRSCVLPVRPTQVFYSGSVFDSDAVEY